MTRELPVHALKLEYMLRYGWIAENDVVDFSNRIVRLHPELIQQLTILGLPNTADTLKKIETFADSGERVIHYQTPRMIYVCGENLGALIK
jgi:hypothetical protein